MYPSDDTSVDLSSIVVKLADARPAHDDHGNEVGVQLVDGNSNTNSRHSETVPDNVRHSENMASLHLEVKRHAVVGAGGERGRELGPASDLRRAGANDATEGEGCVAAAKESRTSNAGCVCTLSPSAAGADSYSSESDTDSSADSLWRRLQRALRDDAGARTPSTGSSSADEDMTSLDSATSTVVCDSACSTELGPGFPDQNKIHDVKSTTKSSCILT
ncbi:uncharacterized protein [Battus philenor]|uniref:uncharacterized protein n=1 Tax=Battus philenor TaxID=42288 RepID=UPI0035CFCA79